MSTKKHVRVKVQEQDPWKAFPPLADFLRKCNIEPTGMGAKLKEECTLRDYALAVAMLNELSETAPQPHPHTLIMFTLGDTFNQATARWTESEIEAEFDKMEAELKNITMSPEAETLLASWRRSKMGPLN